MDERAHVLAAREYRQTTNVHVGLFVGAGARTPATSQTTVSRERDDHGVAPQRCLT